MWVVKLWASGVGVDDGAGAFFVLFCGVQVCSGQRKSGGQRKKVECSWQSAKNDNGGVGALMVALKLADER